MAYWFPGCQFEKSFGSGLLKNPNMRDFFIQATYVMIRCCIFCPGVTALCFVGDVHAPGGTKVNENL